MPLFGLVEENLRAAMRCYSFASVEGEIRELPGVTIASCGMNYPVFNSAMLTSPVEGGEQELDQRIALAAVHFKARMLGWSFWLCEDLISPGLRCMVAQIFRKRNMEPIAQPPGMLAAKLEPSTRQLPCLNCRRVNDDRTRFDFSDVASVVFSLPFATSTKIYGPESTWKSGMAGYVGYLNGKPVSIVATIATGRAIGIYSLGTLPQHQGYGLGETLIRHAVAESQRENGLDTVVLQATKEGFGLYVRMGFRIVTSFAVYLREGCD
ncbi:MAG TPA: GNAT family N-acetyltransferase [Bryobacteraceae bacterium]|nr:GNAT family N-acetyltransferase [Bryobacteraceae bacterium]